MGCHSLQFTRWLRRLLCNERCAVHHRNSPALHKQGTTRVQSSFTCQRPLPRPWPPHAHSVARKLAGLPLCGSLSDLSSLSIMLMMLPSLRS
eukprot:741473-Prymnesium_polylepis.1